MKDRLSHMRSETLDEARAHWGAPQDVRRRDDAIVNDTHLVKPKGPNPDPACAHLIRCSTKLKTATDWVKNGSLSRKRK